MREVTNPKLVDLTPTWKPYVGWTVLFCPAVTTCDPYSVADESPGNRELYAALATWYGALDLPATAPLPPDTYHVTVCDGLSPMRDGRLDDRWRRRVRRRLRRLPDSLARLDRPTMGHAAEVEALVEACRRPARLRVTGVETRGTAVVATLEPADDGWFAAIDAARTSLLDALGSTLHARLTTAWRPHVTLAYVADRAATDALSAPLAAVNPPLEAVLAGQTLLFEAADVFAFDDMVTFHRRRR